MTYRTSLTALTVAAFLTVAHSNSAFANPTAVEAAIKAHDFAKAESLLNAALKANPSDASALIGRAQLAVALNDSTAIDSTITNMQSCVAADDKNAKCYYYLGMLSGLKAMRSGISAVSLASKSKEALERSVELAPTDIRARMALTQFYLMAPGLMGGSNSKARTQAQEMGKLDKASGQMLEAMSELNDENLAAAEKRALAVGKQTDAPKIETHLELLGSVGGSYVRGKKYADASRVFEAVRSFYPEEAVGYFGLGRVAQEQGKGDEAIALFLQSYKITPSATTQYRLGQIYNDKGDKTRAVEALNKALSLKPALSTRQKEDAQKLLTQLKT